MDNHRAAHGSGVVTRGLGKRLSGLSLKKTVLLGPTNPGNSPSLRTSLSVSVSPMSLGMSPRNLGPMTLGSHGPQTLRPLPLGMTLVNKVGWRKWTGVTGVITMRQVTLSHVPPVRHLESSLEQIAKESVWSSKQRIPSA
jgi:hypothetical protein